MSLSKRFFIVFILCWFFISALTHFSIRHIISSRFQELETAEIDKTAQRLYFTLNSILDEQMRLLKDWAEWDDTREYVLGTYPQYEDDITSLKTLLNLDINIILIYDINKQLVLGKQVDLDKGMFFPLNPSDIETFFMKYPMLSSTKQSIYAHGLATFNNQPVLVTASPILNNEGDGPSNGSLVYIRYINETFLKNLSQQVQMPVSYHEPEPIPDHQHHAALYDDIHKRNWNILFDTSPDTISIIAGVEDLNNAPSHAFTIHMERSIFKAGQMMLKYLTVNNIAFAIVALFIFAWLTYSYVIKRIQNLYTDVSKIDVLDIENTVVTVNGTDEIARLGQEINSLLNTIRISQLDIYLKNKELIQSQKDLEKRVNQRTTDLQRLTDKLENELELKAVREKDLLLLANVFKNTYESIVITDDKGDIIDVNNAFCRLSGYSKSESIGGKPNIIKSDKHDSIFFDQMWSDIIKEGRWSGEVWNKRKDGSLFPVILNIDSVEDERLHQRYYIGIMHDITALKANESELEKQAYYDALTGLPNRALCHDRMNLAFKNAKRNGTKVGIMFLDLDKFKQINDSLGHDIGDLLLQGVAERICACTREIDTVCRLGGDEFVIILPEITDIELMSVISSRVLKGFETPFDIDGKSIFSSTSIGMSIYPDDGLDSTTLIKNADIAMYRSKETSNGTAHFFSSDMEAHIQELFALEEGIRNGIDTGEITTHFQPIIDTKTEQIIAFEALARWYKNETPMMPDQFISVLEDSKLMCQFTSMVLEQSFAFAQQLNLRNASEIIVSINISISDLKSGSLLNQLQSLSKTYEVPQQMIELEINESAMIEDPELIEALQSIAHSGYLLSLDDFGKRYSSFSHFNTLPISKIKIDKSFTHQTDDHQLNNAICQSLSLLARNMNISIVTEGVETIAQSLSLQKIGCFIHQGFLYSKAISPDQLEELLTRYPLKTEERDL